MMLVTGSLAALEQRVLLGLCNKVLVLWVLYKKQSHITF